MTLRWSPKAAPRGTVVLLHDVLSMSETWWRVGPALASRGWYTIAPDLAGHGGMPKLSRSLDLAELVQGVVERMPGKADILVGHGLGAIVALALAGRYTDAARAVVLEDPPGSNLYERIGFLDSAGSRSASVRSDRTCLITQETASHPAWAKEDVAYAVDAVAAADVPAILAGLRSRLEWDIRRLLAYVRVPVLVLAASEELNGRAPADRSALSTIDRKAVESRLPAQHFAVLSGGHYIHRDVPREWLSSFAEFADSVLPDTVPEEDTVQLAALNGSAALSDHDEERDDEQEEEPSGDDGWESDWQDDEHKHEKNMLLFDRRRAAARSAAKTAKTGKTAAKSGKTAAKTGKAGKTGKTPAKTGGKAAGKTGGKTPTKVPGKNQAKLPKAGAAKSPMKTPARPPMRLGRGR